MAHLLEEIWEPRTNPLPLRHLIMPLYLLSYISIYQANAHSFRLLPVSQGSWTFSTYRELVVYGGAGGLIWVVGTKGMKSRKPEDELHM